MPEILEKVEVPEAFSNRVERDGEIYLAGLDNIDLSVGHIHGRLYLQRFEGKVETRIWNPSFRNPFGMEVRSRDRWARVFNLESWSLPHREFNDFRDFVKDLNRSLASLYGVKMSFEDAELFFREVYDYYGKFDLLR